MNNTAAPSIVLSTTRTGVYVGIAEGSADEDGELCSDVIIFDPYTGREDRRLPLCQMGGEVWTAEQVAEGFHTDTLPWALDCYLSIRSDDAEQARRDAAEALAKAEREIRLLAHFE